MYDNLCNDIEKPLYLDYYNFIWLSIVLRLFNRNTLPTCNYDANKILCSMGIEYKKIHTCSNDCILYIKEFDTLHECSFDVLNGLQENEVVPTPLSLTSDQVYLKQ
uniref:Uncharacterized protein n=1 Tax=Cajanus cajan TaxID=3821 RepID=A0A151UGF0_CAJCA